ncbi:MAG: nucleotidyltransferase family protein [Ferruginibacter sp.]
MLIKECIILAGGLGTRLRSVVPDLPKCMAIVAGEPFLFHVIHYLQKQGIEKFIFSLGYLHNVIIKYIEDSFPELFVKYSIEDEPLGTGGAIQLALQEATGKDVFVVNGDTLFKVDLSEMSSFHSDNNASCSLALKPMKDFERYGVVGFDADHSIISFSEKKQYKKGYINGGVYALHVPSFLDLKLPAKFSFEKDYLEKYFLQQNMKALVQDTYFIDIGVPEDFERANREMKKTIDHGQ